MRELRDFIPGRLVRSKATGNFGFIICVRCYSDRYPTIDFVWESGKLTTGDFIQYHLDSYRIQLLDFYLTYEQSERLNDICWNMDVIRQPKHNPIDMFKNFLKELNIYENFGDVK